MHGGIAQGNAVSALGYTGIRYETFTVAGNAKFSERRTHHGLAFLHFDRCVLARNAQRSF